MFVVENIAPSPEVSSVAVVDEYMALALALYSVPAYIVMVPVVGTAQVPVVEDIAPGV